LRSVPPGFQPFHLTSYNLDLLTPPCRAILTIPTPWALNPPSLLYSLSLKLPCLLHFIPCLLSRSLSRRWLTQKRVLLFMFPDTSCTFFSSLSMTCPPRLFRGLPAKFLGVGRHKPASAVFNCINRGCFLFFSVFALSHRLRLILRHLLNNSGALL